MKVTDFFVVLNFIFSLTCCGNEGGAPSCVSKYSVSEGYDFESYTGYYPCASCDGLEDVLAECQTVDDIIEQATSNGYALEASEISVTREGAICLAREKGLDSGEDGYCASLRYFEDQHRPAWFVHNLLLTNEDGQYGEVIVIDAVNGLKLGVGNWDTDL